MDGYERKMVYFWCSINNKSQTVMSMFESAIEKYGLPSLVCGDQGVENIAVPRYVFAHPQRGPGRRSFIADKPCQNQRTERLWRDVFTSLLSKFYCVFWYIEDPGLLEIADELQLFFIATSTAQKMKFPITDFFSKCDQICSFLRIWSHLLKKSIMENLIFCAV